MTLSWPRRKLLADLGVKPCTSSPKYPPVVWALREGLIEAVGDKYQLTALGRAELAKIEMSPELKMAVKLLPRLAHAALCRQSSATDEAMLVGGGYLYFIEPGHRSFPPGAGRVLIEAGYVTPQGDGLFPGSSQTFTVAAA